MTTTRINHTGHNHPSTTAARTACRKAMKSTPQLNPVRVIVGKGETIHTAVMANGEVVAARCGAGMQRGRRAASILQPVRSADVTCTRCVKIG